MFKKNNSDIARIRKKLEMNSDGLDTLTYFNRFTFVYP